jgi:hypothetical protein
MTLNVEWRSGSPPSMLADNKTLSDLGVACYRSADDSFVTPAIGSMATGLHRVCQLNGSVAFSVVA